MLLDHDVDGLLGIVQIELVVFSFLLLLALLPLITGSVCIVVRELGSSAPGSQLDGDSLGCPRLGQAVLRSAKNLLLQLHLLSELLCTLAPSVVLIHHVHGRAITLEEVLRGASRILG